MKLLLIKPKPTGVNEATFPGPLLLFHPLNKTLMDINLLSVTGIMHNIAKLGKCCFDFYIY